MAIIFYINLFNIICIIFTFVTNSKLYLPKSAKTLSKIYHNPKDSDSLNKVERLLKRARQLNIPGVSRQTVLKYLWSEQAYTLYKQARRRLTRNHTYVAKINAQLLTDLADNQGIAKQNGELRYLLTVIDVFSKFAWVIPVHSKDAKAITAAYDQMLIISHSRHPSAPTNRQKHGVLQLGFQGFVETP